LYVCYSRFLSDARWWAGVIPKHNLLVLHVDPPLLNSERLAVLELLLPAGVLFLRLVILESQRFRGRLGRAARRSRISYSALLVVLASSEYFRSWVILMRTAT